MKLKIPDIIIILIVSAFTFLSAYEGFIKKQSSLHILIKGQDSRWTFPVSAEETVAVAGPLGNTIIRIHGSFAWVESSPCKNQTCVASGSVKRQGQWAACLPNNVLLVISGTGDEDVDTVAW